MSCAPSGRLAAILRRPRAARQAALIWIKAAQVLAAQAGNTIEGGVRLAATATAVPSAPTAPLRNAQIAAALEEIADCLDIEAANPFRVRAYRNAARVVEGCGRDLGALLAAGEALPKMPGIGADLAGKIDALARTGSCPLLRQLRRDIPPSVLALLKVPGLGPNRVRVLYRDLGIRTAEQLLQAARAGRIRALAGFGTALERKLLAGVQAQLQRGRRWPLGRALPVAEALARHLRQAPGVQELAIAGSLRRARDTIGDVDLVAAAAAASPVMERFIRYGDVAQVLSRGATRGSVLLRSGLQVDLRVMAPEAFGAGLLYFTGSKAHSIALRRRAQQRGLKLSEYGLFRGEQRLAGASEADVYRALGLPYLEPELREDRGELEAADAGRLPKLVTRADLHGDLHAHTSATDGVHTLEEMAAGARQAGLSYLAITDHSQHLGVAHGLDAAQLARQIDAIDALNARLHGITLLKGVEVDILEDGRLDLPDAVLARLDLVVAAVHSRLDLPRQRQTRRVLRAMERPCFSILAHPNGRLLEARGPCEIDMAAVIAAARDRGCFLELNAQPQRLDLFAEQCRMAKDLGVLISIASDAHAAGGFSALDFGIGQARRGWLEARDVLNTRSLAALKPLLANGFRRGI